MIYKIVTSVKVYDEKGRKVTEFANDSFINGEQLSAVKEVKEDSEVERLKHEVAELTEDNEWYREKYLEGKSIIQFFDGLVKSQLNK